LTAGTTISNCRGKNTAVIDVSGDSSLYIEDGTVLNDNDADDGNVIRI